MASVAVRQSMFMKAFTFVELIFHTTVREVRVESGGNAILGLLAAVSRILMMVMLFYFMFAVLGIRGNIIRGDIILFLAGGILLFFMHNTALSKTLKAASFVGPLMQHAPMTPTLAIISAALAVFYIHILAMAIILSALFLLRDNASILDPTGMIVPFTLAWASGVVNGLLLLVIKPFMPKAVALLSTVYQRANLVTSGKFFVANLLPQSVLPFFAWNPLFHCIDQMRGAMFVNYFPKNTNLSYPMKYVFAGIVIGLMFEFWLRKTVSKSTSAR